MHMSIYIRSDEFLSHPGVMTIDSMRQEKKSLENYIYLMNLMIICYLYRNNL